MKEYMVLDRNEDGSVVGVSWVGLDNYIQNLIYSERDIPDRPEEPELRGCCRVIDEFCRYMSFV